jgi:hypothetical protein
MGPLGEGRQPGLVDVPQAAPVATTTVSVNSRRTSV